MSEPRAVIVTGASRGIGLGIATTLAEQGFRVVAIARSQSEALRAKATALDGSGSIHFVSFDLEQLDDVPDLVRDLRKSHGPIYGLVNNAAISGEGVLATMPTASIERLLHLNTLAPIVLTKHVARSMMAASAGRIINISSIIATTGYSGLSVYAASKAAMIGFTRSLAREMGQVGVTVNVVAPGFVRTDMTSGLDDAQRAKIARRAALGRLAAVEEVAAAVAFLMSDAASGITGTVMTVDAGNTA